MRTILVLAFTLSIQFLFAQPFTEIIPSIPFEDVALSSVAFSDIDQDSDQDVLITGFTDGALTITKLYVNDGLGNFLEVLDTPFENVESSSVSFADVDGDNDEDLLISGRNESNNVVSKLYINDGEGNFTESMNTPFVGVDYGAIAFKDVDGDSDQDVLITGSSSSDDRVAKLYLNDGNGNFSETSTPFDGVHGSSIAFADVDGDNDQDVLITGENNSNLRISKLYINNGSGGFSEMNNTPFAGVIAGSAAFADIDNDNDQDLVITGLGSEIYSSMTKLYLNDGGGDFLEVSSVFENVHDSSVQFIDIDNDNDSDLLLTGRNIDAYHLTKLYLNDGAGNFEETVDSQLDDFSNCSLEFADIDNDQDYDLLITGLSHSRVYTRLYINNGNGVLNRTTGLEIRGEHLGSTVFVDVDGDNDQDLVVYGEHHEGYHSTQLYINNGIGQFHKPHYGYLINYEGSSIAFADIDNDNDQDALKIGRHPSSLPYPISRLLINDGEGRFASSLAYPIKKLSHGSISFADIDADNDQDVLVTGKDENEIPFTGLYLNDGTGEFDEVPNTPFPDVCFSSTEFVDIDEDNDLDAMIIGQKNDGELITNLYLNDGLGNFTQVTNTTFENIYLGSIAFADIDGDFDQDLLLSGTNNNSEPSTKLYANDGTGNFIEVLDTLFPNVSECAVKFSDIDQDNDQDVLISGLTSSSTLTTKMYINDGNGNFSELASTPFEQVSLGSISFADIDGDNDQDVLITGRNAASQSVAKLYKNDGLFNTTEEIETDNGLGIILYPNPSQNNQIYIEYESSENEQVKISIMDSNGRIIFSQYTLVNFGHNQIPLNYSISQKGMYVLELETGKQKSASKFLVQ